MNKYYNVYDDVYDNGKEDRNYNNNADYGSVSNGLIFDPITTPWSCLCIAEEDRATTKMMLRPRYPMYLHIGIYLTYRYPINSIVNMFHKLLYVKIGVLDLCC